MKYIFVALLFVMLLALLVLPQYYDTELTRVVSKGITLLSTMLIGVNGYRQWKKKNSRFIEP
jgi:hypothetical protein